MSNTTHSRTASAAVDSLPPHTTRCDPDQGGTPSIECDRCIPEGAWTDAQEVRRLMSIGKQYSEIAAELMLEKARAADTAEEAQIGRKCVRIAREEAEKFAHMAKVLDAPLADHRTAIGGARRNPRHHTP